VVLNSTLYPGCFLDRVFLNIKLKTAKQRQALDIEAGIGYWLSSFIRISGSGLGITKATAGASRWGVQPYFAIARPASSPLKRLYKWEADGSMTGPASPIETERPSGSRGAATIDGTSKFDLLHQPRLRDLAILLQCHWDKLEQERP
jgi:hypothetical protein